MYLDFILFYPQSLEDLWDNRITFGAIGQQFEAGLLILGFGFAFSASPNGWL